jgi:hypothetical protein
MYNADQYITSGGSSQKQATTEATEWKGEHEIEINGAAVCTGVRDSDVTVCLQQYIYVINILL